MQLNDVATGQGIFQEIDSLCDSDINSYTANDKTRRVNAAVIELEIMALQADGRWRFDDSNYSSLPTGLMSAVDGTSVYTFDSTLLFLERIDILLKDGVTWLPLDHIDDVFTDLTNTDLAVQATPSGYYLRGNKFGFNTVPKTANMTLTNGIRVIFKRAGAVFVPSDTTKEPGIVVDSHPLVAQKASLPYCRTYKKDRVAGLMQDIAAGEKKHKLYYANRNKGEKGQMTMKKFRFR